jgi:asparagine synthase (glutamine-hydrolysing)
MLEQLIHRGNDAHEVVIPLMAVSAKSLNELKKHDYIVSEIAIGRNMSRIISGETEQSLITKSYALTFEGRLYPLSATSNLKQIANRLGNSLLKHVKLILQKFDGSYTFAIASSQQILVGRDPMGTSPLYYGENRTICAVASERKALWKIGVKDVKSFPPGNIARINGKGFSFRPFVNIKTCPQKAISMSEATSKLQNLLLESTRKRVSDVEKVAVAFSGGLDSSLIAVFAKKCKVDVHLVTVGLTGQVEIEHAKIAAKSLGLPLTLHLYDVENIERTLTKVLWLIEEPDAMKVGVAIPFFWAAEIASKLDCPVLLAGQGADELFGGYRRYLTEYAHGDAEAVQNIINNDVMRSYETNFQRDNPVCAFHKVELRLPFADREVVRFALSLPLKLKIASPEDVLRKKVLRHLALAVGIPAFIANRTKKAIQFATGIDKTLRKLAKDKGLTFTGYINQAFKEAYSSLEGRK